MSNPETLTKEQALAELAHNKDIAEGYRKSGDAVEQQVGQAASDAYTRALGIVMCMRDD